MKTYDVANLVLSSATDKFGSEVQLNKSKSVMFEVLCGVLDIVSRDLEAKNMEIEVDEATRNITISMSTMLFEVDNPEDPFLKILDHCEKMMITNLDCDEDYLKISFVFSGIWDEVGDE